MALIVSSLCILAHRPLQRQCSARATNPVPKAFRSMYRKTVNSGEQIRVTMGPGQVVDEYPKNRYQRRATLVPLARPANYFDIPAATTVPGDVKLFPLGRRSHDRLRSGQLGPLLAGPMARPLAENHRRRIAQVGVGIEEADQTQMTAVPMCEAGQGVGAVTAVAREDELAVGEPVDQDSQHLLHQFRGRLVPPPLPAVFFLGQVQRHQQRQRPSTSGKGDPDKHGQGDPLVPPAVGGEGVSGTDRVAMATLAVNVLAGVLLDGVVASQFDGALGYKPGEDLLGKTTCQRPRGPAVAGEDAVITAGVSRSQRAQTAEQVGDGVSPQSQDRGEGKEDESVMGRMRESWFDGVKDSTDLFGQLVVNPIDLPPRRTSFSGLLASRCTALVAELFLGLPLAGTVGYSGHGSLLVRDAAPGRYLPSQQGGLPSENPKKRQKSS